jgi:hypothetical protein
MPMLDHLFVARKDGVQTLLKNLQVSTRSFQHMCTHSKVGRVLVKVISIEFTQFAAFEKWSLDEPCSAVEENSGNFSLPREGDAHPEQVHGGFLVGKSQKSRSSGQCTAPVI